MNYAVLVREIGFGKLTVRRDADWKLDLTRGDVEMSRRRSSRNEHPPAEVDTLVTSLSQIDSEIAITLRRSLVIHGRSMGEK